MDQSERDELRQKIAEARNEALQLLQQKSVELTEADFEDPRPTCESAWCCPCFP